MLRITEPQIVEFFSNLAGQFGLRHPERHVPHLTLAGPFRLVPAAGIDRILHVVEESSRRTRFVSCTLHEFTILPGRIGQAVVLHADPDPALLDLFHSLSSNLRPYFSEATWIDWRPGERRFHVTLGSGLHQGRAEAIVNELAGQTSCSCRETGGNQVRSGMHLDLFRISIARNGALWREYDLSRGKWLDRAGTFNRKELTATLTEFRTSRGFELGAPWFESYHEIFLIADLHLGHENIIRYCHRPFPDAATMDRVLIRNWQFRVQASDRVYFLGDLAYGPGARPMDEYLSLLPGDIRFIKGNHDRGIPGMLEKEVLDCEGLRFMCVHDPSGAPESFQGWILHGHHHNNHTRDYPFLDAGKQRVNVSCELIGYVPLSLRELVSLIKVLPAGARFATLAEARDWRYGLNHPERGDPGIRAGIPDDHPGDNSGRE